MDYNLKIITAAVANKAYFKIISDKNYFEFTSAHEYCSFDPPNLIINNACLCKIFSNERRNIFPYFSGWSNTGLAGCGKKLKMAKNGDRMRVVLRGIFIAECGMKVLRRERDLLTVKGGMRSGF